MALILADRVQETTNTTGTGTLTLAGAVSGFQSFAAIGNSNTTYYTILSGTDWENGLETYTSSGTTLARTTILSSSNFNTAINVAAGASVFATYPAERAVILDGGGNIPQTVTTDLGTTVLPGEMIYRLNAGVVGANSTAVQKILGVGVTLASNTVYQFEGMFTLSKTVGTTSHTIGIHFPTTGTTQTCICNVVGQWNATTLTSAPSAIANVIAVGITSGGGNTVITGAIANATANLIVIVKGTIHVNTGGVVTPSYTLSAAPGGAYTTNPASYFKFSPIGTTALVNVGTWV